MTPARRLRAAVLRVASLGGRARRERELADELESHLQLHVDDSIRAGVPPAEARRRAILALGGVEQAKEQYRDRRGLPWLEALLQDLRFGVRMLRRQKTFTAVAVVTLAIGFGPPIAIFTLANWMVLRSVPGVRDTAAVSMYFSGAPGPRGGTTVGRISYLNLRDLAPRLQTVRLAASQGMANAVLAANGRPQRFASGAFVSGDFFDVLGVSMQAGRAIGPADDDPGNPALVAVLSDGLWASLFDRQPAAIGSTIAINGQPVTVIGVADPRFQGPRRFQMEALWLPGVTEPVIRALQGRRADDRAEGGYYQFVARLNPGATWEQADRELALSTTWLLEQYPDANGKLKTIGFHNQGPIDSLGRERLLVLVSIMFAASALVLMIASSNVASLLVMRGVARRGEVAVRRAIGAGRWRVLRQHVTEAMLLWAIGAALGTLLVWGLLRIGVMSALSTLGVPELAVPLDMQALLFAGALALVVGLLFSIFPAWKTSGADPGSVLQGASSTLARRFRVGPVLTVVQLSASLALLVGALMLGATVRHLLALDLGFDPANVTTFHVRAAAGASPEAAYAYVSDFVARLAARPGVESVAVANGAPFYGAGNFFSRVRPRGGEDYSDTQVHQVMSPDFFTALRIDLLHGRSFAAEEIDRPGSERATSAAVVNESLARMLFGTTDVLGRIVEIPQYQKPPRPHAIVGVVRDVRYVKLTDAPAPMIYTPDGASMLAANATVIVRTGNARSMVDEVGAIATALGTPPPRDVRTLDDAVARARGEWDVLAALMVVLAAIASVVAAVGVYGVVGFSAAARRAEFGIRMALGATTMTVRGHIVRTAAQMTAAALLFGLAGGLALVQVLRARLVGVSPGEPAVWAAAAVLLVVIVAIASVGPARQSARTSLAETLRAM